MKNANIISSQNKITIQEVMQYYMFERILIRISNSNYSNNFILKGGLLLSSITGIQSRTTMDMDTLLKGIKLDKGNLNKIICEILSIDTQDGIIFEVIKIEDIRNDNKYGGFRFKILGKFENIKNYLTIDVSTGDIITPQEIMYQFKMIFNEGNIEIKSYNYESILAEKFQTILENNGAKGRMKDYYDIWFYVNFKHKQVEVDLLISAIVNTFKQRKSLNDLILATEIIYIITNSVNLKKKWNEYAIKHNYTFGIEFDSIVDALIHFTIIIGYFNQNYKKGINDD